MTRSTKSLAIRHCSPRWAKQRTSLDIDEIPQPPSNRPAIHLFFVGPPSTGKTSLRRRIKSNRFDICEKPTKGVESATKRLKYRGVITKTKLWDVSGQIRDLQNPFFNQADGVFLVIDLSDPSTVAQVSCWLEVIHQKFGTDFPVTVVGNKCDVKSVETGELRRNFNFVETSAAYCVNIEKMMLALFRRTPWNEVTTGSTLPYYTRTDYPICNAGDEVPMHSVRSTLDFDNLWLDTGAADEIAHESSEVNSVPLSTPTEDHRKS